MLFSHYFQCLNLNMKIIWKFENPRWRGHCDVIMLLWLPWKPIKCHVTILNWKYTRHLLHIPRFMSIGWILLKIEGDGGGPIDYPHPHAFVSLFFSSCLLGLTFLGSISAKFILFVSLSSHRLGSFCLLAQRLFSPGKPLRNSAGSQVEVRNQNLKTSPLPQVAQSRIECLLASLDRSY